MYYLTLKGISSIFCAFRQEGVAATYPAERPQLLSESGGLSVRGLLGSKSPELPNPPTATVSRPRHDGRIGWWRARGPGPQPVLKFEDHTQTRPTFSAITDSDCSSEDAAGSTEQAIEEV